MRKVIKNVTIALLIAISLAAPSVEAAVTWGRIYDGSNNTVNVYYETGVTGSHTYIDRPTDVGIEILGDAASDVQGKYIGALYIVGVNNLSSASYYLVTKYLQNPSPYHALVPTGTAYSCGSGKYCANASLSDLSFMDSLVTDSYGNPTELSAYPAKVWVVVSDDQTIDSGDTFIYLDTSQGWLKGSFTLNDYQSTYDQVTGNISVDVTSVTVYTDVSTTQEIDSNYADKKSIAIGVCEDPRGEFCNSTAFTSKTDSAISLYTGVTTPSDQEVYNKYVVLNGISYPLCIGADLIVQSISAPSSIYAGQSMTINATIQNNNNVNVTTDFNVTFYIDGNMIYSEIVTDNLAPGDTKTVSTTWTANLPSGSHTINVTVDTNNDVAECMETNNYNTQSFTIQKVYTPYIYIDDVLTTSFEYPGRPYNFSVFLNDSDGNIVGNATIILVEENGLSLFAPTQTWNDSYGETGLRSISRAEFRTDSSGWANITVVPTYNPLLDTETNLTNIIGNYSIYLMAIKDGSYLDFNVNGNIQTTYPLNITNKTYTEPGIWHTKRVYHQIQFVQQAIDYVYEIFSIIRKILSSI